MCSSDLSRSRSEEDSASPARWMCWLASYGSLASPKAAPWSCRLGTGISVARHGFADTGARSCHHDFHATSGASGMPTASCADCGWIRPQLHPFGKPARDLGGDVDRERAEVDEAPVPGQWPAAETTGVVADDVERAESVDKATDHTLARRDEGARPDENSSQRRCWPHGGRQLSWWCHGRCHRMA